MYIISHQNLESDSSKEQDFKYVQAGKNHSKNRCQKFLPRKNTNLIVYWLSSIVDIADSARVVIPKLDGNSDYINFCYIDVGIKLYCAINGLYFNRVMIKAKHFWLDLDPCSQQPVIFGL